MSGRIQLNAYIEHFVYRNADTGYGVAHLVQIADTPGGETGASSVGDTEDLPEGLLEEGKLTAVGTFHGADEGDAIEAEGEIVIHPVYGAQLRITHFHVITPTDAVGAERYLASGVIRGIGERLAHRIVKHFGDDTFRIMEEEPERLAEMKGISIRMAREIGIQMRE